ncbi:MAG: hypothetical protein HYX68_02300 [Planctomycetes bacterium]|nr:hypothetical protein [Planctomycetota bacterium]
MRRALWVVVCASVVLFQLGCRQTCGRRPWCGSCGAPAQQPAIYAPAPQPIVQPAPIQQSGAIQGLPPGALLQPPPGAQIRQPGSAPSISNAPPMPPAESREPPRPESKRDVPPRIQLYAPESLEKETPAPAKKPSVQATLPPIPQFGVARDNLFTGLRPGLDGLDWLRDNRIATVVQLRLPGEDDSSDKKQVEDRGMRYVSLEISPESLTKDKADEFIKLIRDGARKGIFVYDQDGSLAGAMWYLYFRAGEFLDDDVAQLRARQLGLQGNRAGQHREMWLAVRKLLNENSP